MTATTLLLVRHAHADWQPDETRPLSEVGRRDAARVAGVLSPLAPTSIYSSPYRRARQTVEPGGIGELQRLWVPEDPS